MKKSYVIATFISILFGSINSVNASASSSGFYVGAEVGYLYEDHDYLADIVGMTNDISKEHKGSGSCIPGLLTGYRFFIQNFFVGGELAAYLNFSKTKHIALGTPGVGDNATFRTKGSFDFVPSIVFGYAINYHCIVYGKTGVDIGRYKYSFSEIFTPQHLSKKKTFVELLLGGGFEYAFNKCWSGRLEVTYVFPRNRNDINENFGVNKYHSKVKIDSTAFKLGLFYKF